MKKSLSAILSLAMAFSMFSSVALGADAAKDSSSFSDLKDLDAATKAKFDEMIKSGIYDGVKEGTFGLNDKMNRAQFAKVAALIFGLKVDTSLKASSFSDVKADDPANGYALPYIEAVKAAGITDGYAPGQFNPAGEVTKEQLATFLVRGLGFEALAKSTPGVSDKTVSDWAKGYVAVAIEKKVMTSGADGTFGGSSAAVRSQLVVASYEAKKQYVPPVGPVVTNVSIAKAEATGAKAITVTLNGALADTAKLNVSVLRGGAAITSKATWNSTKNQVVLTTDGKLVEGTYTVKIEAVKDGGLTVTDKGTADIAVQNEKITKIDFLSSSDTVGQGKKVKIDFKAVNQYNEQSDLAASRFTIATSPDLGAQYAGDAQSITVNVYEAVKPISQGGKGLLVRDQMFAVTIMAPDNTAQVSKTYKVGDVQSVAKVELGDFKFQNGKTQLESGDTATIAYKAFDQYGFEVTDIDTLRNGTTTYFTGAGAILSGTDVDGSNNQFNKGFDFFDEDTDNDKKPDLKVIAAQSDSNSFLSDQDVTLSVVAHQGGTTTTKNVKVAAPKTPYELSFGTYNKTISWGDEDFYIPIVVKDKMGNTLSVDDVVKYADDINIYGYGTSGVVVGTNSRVEKTGAYRGQLKVTGLRGLSDENTRKSGTLTINALVTKSGKSATYSTTVLEKRYPNQVYVSSEPKAKQLPSLKDFGQTYGLNNLNSEGLTENKMKIKFKDQYGEDIDLVDYTGYKVQINYAQTAGTVANAVYFSKGSLSNPAWNNPGVQPTSPAPATGVDMNAAPTWRLDNDSATATVAYNGGSVKTNYGYGNTLEFVGDDARVNGYSAAANTIKSVRDTDLSFTSVKSDSENLQGTYQATIKLLKNDGTVMSTVTRSVDLIPAKKASELTYAVTAIANGIWAVDKTSNGVNLPGATLTDTAALNDSYDKLATVGISGANDRFALENLFAAKLEVTAKDSSGSTVALPNQLIKNVSVTNTKAAQVVKKPKADQSNVVTYDNFGIRGLDNGTTSATVTFYPSNFTGLKSATLDNIAIKDEALYANSLTAGENGKVKTITVANLSGLNVSDGGVNKKTFGDIKIKDQFGNSEFKNYSVYRTADLFGVQFLVSNVKWSDPANPGTLSVDVDKVNGTAKYNYVAGNGGASVVTSFTASVITANGKSQSVDVNVTQ